MTVGHLERLGIETEIVRSSELEPTETKSALILELCIKVAASVYLSGPFGREYLDLTAFESAGIRVAFHDYAHPEYPQHQGGDFVPYMAAIDALLNCGPDTRSILASGNPGREDYLG
jgi:hypothetical protein